MKVWIKFNKKNVIESMMINQDVESNLAENEVVIEIDKAPNIGGPDIVKPYKWDGEKIVRRTKREIYKDIRKNKKKKIFRKTDNFNVVLEEYDNLLDKFNDLFITGILLAISTGVVGSLLIEIINEFSLRNLIIFFISIIVSVILIIIMIFRGSKNSNHINVRGTAITWNNEKNEICLPKIISMDKNNLYNRPFIIRLINPYNYYKEKMSKSDAFEYVDRILLLGIIKQIIAVSEKVKNDVNQSLEIYKGPIQGGATFEPMQYYPVMIEDICEEKEFINEITENLNVDFLELPAYMKLKISYKKKNITYKIGKLQLNINLSFGNGGNLNHSQWKRSFNCARSNVNYCGMSVLFELIIKRRRINIVKIFRKNKIWKDEEYLKYLVFMAEKLGDEIDWLEDDVDIEEKNRFILLEDNPPKYSYAMGAIPPGNGCVVYDLN